MCLRHLNSLTSQLLHGQESFEYTSSMPTKTAPKKGWFRSNRGWKDVQSKKQKTERNKLAFMIIGVIIALLLLSQVVKFTQMLFSPWKTTPSTKKTTLWNGDFNFNIVIKAKEVSLLSYSPQNQKITIVDIPKNIYLEVSHGLGKWQMGSLYELGESQEDLGGGKLLKDTLVNFLGLPIDGFLDFSGKYSQEDAETIVSEIRKDLLSIFNILPLLKTDLTPFELIRLKIGLSSVRYDKINQLDLEKDTDSLQEEKLADGSEVLNADIAGLDSVFSGLKDSTIQSEHKTIAIFNCTNHPGLAQKAARIIANIGGDVIITSNGQEKLKNTQVVGEKSKSLERIKQIFNAGDIIEASNEDLVSSRAQINVFLGEDFFDSL